MTKSLVKALTANARHAESQRDWDGAEHFFNQAVETCLSSPKPNDLADSYSEIERFLTRRGRLDEAAIFRQIAKAFRALPDSATFDTHLHRIQ